jgi:hypothetical protein
MLEMRRQRLLVDAADHKISRGSTPMSSEKATADRFDQWWARNHPFDWWAKDRKGEPLSHGDRLRVWELCQRAHNDRAAEVGRLREAAEYAERELTYIVHGTNRKGGRYEHALNLLRAALSGKGEGD